MIRRATAADADFVASLLEHEEVEPFLAAVRPRGRDEILERIERSQREPGAAGVFVIEDGGRPAGVMQFERANERSRIAHLGGLAVHPDCRGRGLAEEAAQELQRYLLLDLGYHRLQLEVYGFNERSIRHAERTGFVREGVKRRAYRRHGEWADGVMYALLREDLGLPPRVDALYEYVARFNRQDWEAAGECFAEDGVLELFGSAIEGRQAIVAAYTARPPDDEIRLLDVEDGDPVVATYAWSVEPAVAAGELRARFEGGQLARLTVA